MINKIIDIHNQIISTKSKLFHLTSNNSDMFIWNLLNKKYNELNNLLEELMNIDIIDNIFKINEIENRFYEIMEKNK